MKVSIVIPAYNEEQYIAKTLAQVSQQNVSFPYEIIVVDNASTDRTHEIASGLEPRVKVFREDKKGVQFARQRGFEESTGEILAYLDADCAPSPDWLACGVAHFDDPRVVGVSGPSDYYDSKRRFRISALLFQRVVYRFTNHLANHLLHKGGVMIGGNSFIRRSALERIGGFNTSITFYGDDTDMARRLTEIGRVAYEKDVTVKTSARRFERMGILAVLGLYLINFFWVLFFKRPFSQ